MDPDPITSEAEIDADLTDPEQDAIDAAAEDVQARLWVRTLTPLLQLRNHDTDPSGRVQFAFDKLFVATCERVTRILESDLPKDRTF